MKFCALTATCEEDKDFFNQYLEEIERLDIDFVIYLDRVSQETKDLFINNNHCVGYFYQDDSRKDFKENYKQSVLDLIPKNNYDWLFTIDIDETFKKDTKEKLKFLNKNYDEISCYWINLWGDKEHIRIDEHCKPKLRAKFFNLSSSWRYLDGLTNAPYKWVEKQPIRSKTSIVDIICFHHGLMTRELRIQHKNRWDRIYTKIRGHNPYKFWEWINDETITPEIINNPYL